MVKERRPLSLCYVVFVLITRLLKSVSLQFKSMEYPFNQTHPLSPSPSVCLCLSSPVCVAGVILALSPTACCLYTMGPACSTNTLTTEEKTNRALILMCQRQRTTQGDKTFDLHAEGHERSPLHMRVQFFIFTCAHCIVLSTTFCGSLFYCYVLYHNMDKSLWRHAIVLLLVLHMRVRDVDKQEFGRHRCEKSLLKIQHYGKRGGRPKHRNSPN